MDLTQNKLTRAEWDSIEIPVNQGEKEILQLIQDGYQTPNIKKNKTESMFSFIKIEKTDETEIFLYKKYFEPTIEKVLIKYCNKTGIQKPNIVTGGGQLKKMKSIDSLRIQNMESNITKNKDIVYEFLLLDIVTNLCKYLESGKSKYSLYLYSLIQLKKASIQHINCYVKEFVDSVIKFTNSKVQLIDIIEHSYDFIEQNGLLLEYEDRELYSHQKQLYSVFRDQLNVNPKLVLYMAPTGTGKTLSPIGLSADYRVIFVCVARHIGLALAKSGISMGKKIAFAFGCETASDIRLHYYSALEFTKDKRSGGIRKVNNANGEKVEIMICDVKSYLVAMHYMLAFNPATKIITYWDEPTITLDYETHVLHETIHLNWTKNKIPNVVLSCATLPLEEDLMPVIQDFHGKFESAEIHTVTSYDCKKSIPLITQAGYAMIPHTCYADFGELMECVAICEKNKTLLRYFDLTEIVKFILFMSREGHLKDRFTVDNYFSSIDEITMISLKVYYLEVLKQISIESWPSIHDTLTSKKVLYFGNKITRAQSLETVKKPSAIITRTISFAEEPVKAPRKGGASGLLVTTEDAYTLTDGPTIFLCEDVAKIGHFYIQQTTIPPTVFQDILRKITRNSELSSSIEKLEKTMEDLENSSTKVGSDDVDKRSPEYQKLYKELDKLREGIRYISIDSVYIPNTNQHQEKWSPTTVSEKAFVPTIEEQVVKDVMGLEIDNYLKVLLLLGVGLFIDNVHPRYLEIMKSMAVKQHLYMIIASSDYIYGTNYSFCHGFLGKDLSNMTREKTLQCLGRIGRGNIQQTYTIRFRDDSIMKKLFTIQERNLETENMCRLFCSDEA